MMQNSERLKVFEIPIETTLVFKKTKLTDGQQNFPEFKGILKLNACLFYLNEMRLKLSNKKLKVLLFSFNVNCAQN